MKFIIATMLAAVGFDGMLYDMACTEEAEAHYAKETRHCDNCRCYSEIGITACEGCCGRG